MRAVLVRSFGTGHCEIRTPYSRRDAGVPDHDVDVTADDLRRVRRVYRQLKGIAGHNVKPYSDLANACAGLRYFTFLRDPVARYLSHFKNRARAYTRDDFERWIGAVWTHDWQTKVLVGEPDADKAIEFLSNHVGFVGLTESFDASLLTLGQWLGLPGFRPEYRSVNRLDEKHRSRDTARARADLSYLDEPEIRERLAAANANDRRLYEHVQRTIFPRQLDAYRGDLDADVATLRRRNLQLRQLREPLSSRVLRNVVYKPALLLRLA